MGVGSSVDVGVGSVMEVPVSFRVGTSVGSSVGLLVGLRSDRTNSGRGAYQAPPPSSNNTTDGDLQPQVSGVTAALKQWHRRSAQATRTSQEPQCGQARCCVPLSPRLFNLALAGDWQAEGCTVQVR